MKVEATEAECYCCHRHIVDTGGCLFTAMEKSTAGAVLAGADEVQSDKQSEEKREGIVEAGMCRDIPNWKHGMRRIATHCLQSIHSSEIFYSCSTIK